jgi:hypothetical protein
MRGKLATFFKLILAKEPEKLLPQPPAEGIHPKVSRLVKEAGKQIRSSADRLGEEIEKAMEDNVRIRRGEWDGRNDHQK